MRRRGEHVVSEARAAELRAQWQNNRERVMCADPDYGTKYPGGFRIRRLPGADDQARSMR